MSSNATKNEPSNVTSLPSTPKAQTAKEVIAANVKLLIEQLEAGHSEGLTAYLTAMGRFHNYSFGNILEIARQRPSATRVAGMYAWNQLGRRINKGEKGIRILAPMIGIRRKKDSKPPFGGPEHVLKYLARYTRRVAISNGRLLSLDNGQVRFRWRDSQHNNRSSVMKLDAVEFIRRFLLHVLPAGFIKIRHFGLLANRNRRQALTLCRLHLSATTPDIDALLNQQQKSALNRSCPQCQYDTLHVVTRYKAVGPTNSCQPLSCALLDSS